MSPPAKKPASYENLLALPDNVVDEILDGELVVRPRPAIRHAAAGFRTRARSVKGLGGGDAHDVQTCRPVGRLFGPSVGPCERRATPKMIARNSGPSAVATSHAALSALRKTADDLAARRNERTTTGHLLAALVQAPNPAAELLRERRLDAKANPHVRPFARAVPGVVVRILREVRGRRPRRGSPMARLSAEIDHLTTRLPVVRVEACNLQRTPVFERPLRWRWTLPTGEKISATLDASGGESVYVGRRLVSRSGSQSASALREHPLPREGKGAYRGGNDARVVFTDVDCSLIVDGAVVPPTPVRKGVPPRWVALLAVASVISVMSLLNRQARDKAARAASRSAIERLPITETHRTADGFLTIHHPADFPWVGERSNGSGATMVYLERSGTEQALQFFSGTNPDSDQPWALDKIIQALAEKRWFRTKLVVTAIERTDGKCHGEEAAIAVRHFTMNGAPVRQWSCTFVHGGRAYRLAAFTPEDATADESYLRSILDLTELD